MIQRIRSFYRRLLSPYGRRDTVRRRTGLSQGSALGPRSVGRRLGVAARAGPSPPGGPTAAEWRSVLKGRFHRERAQHLPELRIVSELERHQLHFTRDLQGAACNAFDSRLSFSQWTWMALDKLSLVVESTPCHAGGISHGMPHCCLRSGS